MVLTTPTDGPATLNSRLQRYTQGTTAPRWAKKMSPKDYQFAYAQVLLTKGKQQDRLVILTGDFNRPVSKPNKQLLAPRHNIHSWTLQHDLLTPAVDTLHNMEGYHTWSNNSSTQSTTIIDHIMHSPLPPNVSITEIGAAHESHLNALSDHLPLWITMCFHTPLTLPPLSKSTATPHRADLDMDNVKQLEQYNTLLEDRLKHSLNNKARHPREGANFSVSAQTSIDSLAIILRQSALTVQEDKQGLGKNRSARLNLKCKQSRGRYKNCYSPQMRQLQSYLHFYQNTLRLAFSRSRHKHHWSQDTYIALLLKWVKEWRSHYHSTLVSIDEFSPAASLLPPEHLSQRSFYSISRHYICDRIRQIKSLLHGTNRKEMRELISPLIRKRERLRATHQLGRLIKELDESTQGTLDLSSLPCPLNGQITDPYTIQQTLNEHMWKWYSIPDHLDPAAEHLARHPYWWRTLISLTDPPERLHARSRIPLQFQKGLRRVCAEKVSPTEKTIIHERLAERITFDEFDATLNGLVNGSAPGPSEATANMIKAWSPSIRTLVFDHMENIWTQRATPKWFKDKVIKLAPKIPGNTELNNMRPISLYEVIRKVWTTILAKRIHQSWHDLDLLHPSQYGYRLDNGTLMALHTIQNDIEDARHTKKRKLLTFWDINRAFDSIPRNIQKLAWIRLGVPDDIAEWFVGLDDGGLSFIDTPHYQRTKALRSIKHLKAKPGHFCEKKDLAFTAERGIGQGESASSLMWTALYDILLEWIDPANRDLHQDEDIHYSNEDIANTTSTAYADDLATTARGPNANKMQQLTTNWLSAFCAFAGLVIHPAKVQSTILNPTDDDLLNPEVLTVHDLLWQPLHCPINPELLTVKYLGVQLDLRATLNSHRLTMDNINRKLAHLVVQAGSPGVKIDCMLFQLIPRIMATAVCANWTLKQYRALDKPFSSIYRLILGLPRNFPAALLYLPRAQMGIGLPRLSDKAQILKWEALARSQAVGGDPADSVLAFFDRLPPSASETKDFIRRVSPPDKWPTKRLFVRSLLEWWHESKLTMSCRLIDPRTQDENYSHNRSLATLAQDLRLHPSVLYSDEDNLNLPLMRLTCSDGSFVIKPRGHFDIITCQDVLNCIGTGSGGIVFLPPAYTEATHTPNCVQITSPTPLPGMNAYAWELVTQLIALHFTAYMPSHHVLTSDCKSAIARTNQALSTRNDQLGNTKGGIFSSGAHQFTNPFCPRKFIHTKGHPEDDPQRKNNPSIRDKAICIADAVADGSEAKLGGIVFPTHRHQLVLTEILDELIPAYQWHLRGHNTQFPVLGDVLQYQHAALLNEYTATRDKSNTTRRWHSTAYSFANQIHPTRGKSYWAAARRTKIAFDWVGHGRNRAKHSKSSTSTIPSEQCCRLCALPDSQTHCMLECPDPRLDPIRNTARHEQKEIYAEIIHPKTPSKFKYFAQQLIHGSWTDSPNLSRIWLGMWNQDTLVTMIKPSLTAPLSMAHRTKYITIARKLTKPLLKAYSAMIAQILTQPLRRSTGAEPTIPMPPLLRNVLENTFAQELTSAPITESTQNLQHLHHICHIDTHTLSDAACSHEYAELTH